MIPAQLRRTVRTLYAFACGYCGVTEDEVGSQLTIDHYQPKDAGGSDEIDNLVYACHACNLHKSAAWNAQHLLVLHPLQTDLSLHLRALPNGTIEALSSQGTLHIETLHLNRPPMVRRRKTKQLMEAMMEWEQQKRAHEAQAGQDLQRKKRLARRRRFR